MGRCRGRTNPEPENLPERASTPPSAGKELGNTRRASLIATALATVLAASGAAADEQQLDEVLVTAPPERVVPEAPPEDPTAFGTVVPATEAATRVETLSDLLSEAVGVRVRRFGGLGDFSTVSVRGFSAGQVQVYLDGIPLSRADNETVNLSDLPLDFVDRVEVYRSATPLAFAQSAPGGVVNVVTRRPPADRPLWAASASGESFGTRKVNLAHGAARGAWEYLGFLHYLGSEGDFTFTNDLGTRDNPADDREEVRRNNAFDQVGALARLRYRTSTDATVTLTSDTFWKDEGVPGAGSVQALDTALATTRELADLALDVPALERLPVALSARAYLLYEHVAFDDPEGELVLQPTRNRDDTLGTGGQLVARGALGSHQLLGALVAVGYERFASEELEQATSPPSRSRLRGTIAGEDEILLWGERVSLVPSLRWEIVRDDFPGDPGGGPTATPATTSVDDYLLPRFGLRARLLPWLTVLGNVGRAVRVPNLQELFGSQGVVLGNPDLEAETAELRDVGLRILPPAWGPLSEMALEVVYFNNPIDDVIVFVQNSQQLVVPENVSSALLTGEEVSARGRIAERLALSVNYTHQDATDESDVSFLRGNRLPGRPQHELYARAELAWSPARPLPGLGAVAPLAPRLYFDANLIGDDYLNRANTERVDSRTLLGTGVSFGLPGRRWQRLRFTFEVRNLTDDQTQDVLGFPLPGRIFSGTLSWGFGDDATP
ncbi:MAG TPA: TonB-dependent receptor [Candidatus Limnocylindria bacterium]|nr:TonB-dependent receptor [Candidatus Limnocylindria bacterium]